jgi:hypothetical protein
MVARVFSCLVGLHRVAGGGIETLAGTETGTNWRTNRVTMGPMIIFDKSTLQSLRIDEACWLDAFFLPVITPLFFVETLTDLQKQVARGRTPEQAVGNLADKTPPNGCANVHQKTLCVSELLGEFTVEMGRRPIVGGGKSTVTSDHRGYFFSPSPEMQALSR